MFRYDLYTICLHTTIFERFKLVLSNYTLCLQLWDLRKIWKKSKY